MDVLEPPQHLVEEELVVLSGEVIVGLDDLRGTEREGLWVEGLGVGQTHPELTTGHKSVSHSPSPAPLTSPNQGQVSLPLL